MFKHLQQLAARFARLPAQTSHRRIITRPFATQGESLETRQLLTAQLVGPVTAGVHESTTAKNAKATPQILGNWELNGEGFAGFLIVNSQNDRKFSAVLTANADFAIPESSIEGTIKGTQFKIPKLRGNAIPTGLFKAKLTIQVDSASTFHGELRGKNNGTGFSYSFSGSLLTW